MPERPALYALLVAIDQYQYPVSPLGGCVNDINRVEQYLKTERDYEVRIEKLIDRDATRDRVRDGFLKHLAKAGPGDVAFFYYAGHGAQEWADEVVWRYEPDRKLEGLVLYDSIPGNSARYRLLADKEIRYLLNKVATTGPGGAPKAGPPHIVTMFDCCHSGENTRNIFLLAEATAADAVHERRFRPEPQARMGTILPVRDWNDFLFAADPAVSPGALQAYPLSEVLPEAGHVQLAACRSDESSYEQQGSGVFTRNLIEVLTRSQGGVSYYDLRSRLRNYIKGQFRQTPQIYEAGGEEQIYRMFLNKRAAPQPLYGNIVYNEKEGWVMDLGALHGVSAMAHRIRVTSEDGKQTFEGRPGAIAASSTQVRFDAATERQLDRRAAYRGYVDGFLSAPISVFIEDRDGDATAADRLRQALAGAANINFCDHEGGADYVVRLTESRYVITGPGDPFRPLVLPADRRDENAAAFTADCLRHISQWEFVKNLHNDGPNRLPLNDVEVTFFRAAPDGQLSPLDAAGEEVVTHYEEQNGGYGGNIRIRVRNRAKYPLNVCLLYLGRRFEVFPDLLSNVVQLLEPGGEAWVFDGGNIELDYEKAVDVYNWPDSETFFKLIASRQEIDTQLLRQGELPDPAELARSADRGIKKGFDQETRKEETVAADAWITRLLTLRLPNPLFNRPARTVLETRLQTAAAPFLRGLYYEKDGKTVKKEVKLG